MQSERWQQIENLFHASKNFEAAERSAYLDHACAGDAGLRAEVESLLSASTDSQTFLTTSAFAKTMDVLSREENNTALGTTLGSYQVLSKLGEGGMGEVYLAEDSKLGRKVAVKLLPTRHAADTGFVARFQQEARSASSLNHPNIITIHEVGEAEGRYFIATEYIEGETLRKRIARSSLNVTEIVSIAIQIASALVTAHAAGIVHRDIKPENIMVRTDGLVKVLDFGLARQQSLAGNRLVNSTPGLILGTVGYMSPEQIRGLPTDERSDIWSFGLVLYEMINSERLFRAETDADLLASIISDQPVKISSDSEIGIVGLQSVLEKCLCKRPESRYSTTQALLEDLRKISIPTIDHSHVGRTKIIEPVPQSQDLSHDGFVTSTIHRLKTFSSFPSAAPKTLNTRKRIVGLTFAVVSLLIAGFSLRGYMHPKSPTLPRQLKVKAVTSGGTWSPHISADGGLVAYTAIGANMQESVWIKETVTGNSRQVIPADGARYSNYAFSHDGHLYYTRADPHFDSSYFLGDAYRIPVIGGTPSRIASNISGNAVLSPDDSHLGFLRVDPSAREYRLIVAGSDGSGERVIATQKWPTMAWVPSWSPDGRTLSYCVRLHGQNGFYNTVMGVPVDGGPARPLTSAQWMDVGAQIWLPDGQGLLITGREHPGDPFQIYQISYPVGEVHRITNDTNSYSALSITTDSKRLIAEVDDLNSNIWVMTNGNPASARQITYTGKDGVGGISWTPDGRVVYATISRDSYNQTGASGDKAIWVIDADGQNRKQLTFDDGINSDPAVSPDGRYIVFSAYRDGAWGIWRMNIDGSDAIQLATGGALTNPACTPDGQWVLFKRLSTSSELNICRVSIHGGEIVEVTDKNAFAPSVSPDGKLVAFFSTEETRNLLRVVPLAGGEPVKTLNVSPDNDYLLFANITHWSHDGRLLTYSDSKRHVSNIYGVPFNGGPITQLTHFNSDIIFNFAWSFDGSKLAVAKGQFTRMVVSITDFSPETIPNP